MTDAKASAEPPNPPPPPARAMTTGTASPLLPPSAAARQRLPQRASSQQNASPSPRRDPFLRRRSSLLSISSIGDATQSFTDDIIDPRTGRRRKNEDEDNELSHWHSSPLAFAILPAVGGLMFQNGSAFVTDILLLGLAAIFMNWSIRLPWDWYYSAQAIRKDVEFDEEDEEDELDGETAVDTASSVDGSPKPNGSGRSGDRAQSPVPGRVIAKQQEAAADLRRQELWALGATFAFPVLAAYLLHVIRAQLSTSSTGLVSDYNLSVFLLAAEIRPVRQVIRLIANRTVYLQRVANSNTDYISSEISTQNMTDDLTARLADLEAKLADNTVVPASTAIAQKDDVRELSTELKKRYEPRLDSLERAMRRYEKRASALSLQIDDRLLNLEQRLQEALSLAAVAAQNSQGRGFFTKVVDATYTLIALPVKVVYDVCLWPLKALDELYWKLKTILLGPAPPKSGKRRGGRLESSSGTGREEKPREKASSRKVVR